MKHLGTQTLETPRLVLRRFTLQDAGAMYQNWAQDPQVTKYLRWPTHESAEVSKAVLREWESHYGEADYYSWAMVLRETGEPIGSMGVVEKDDRTEKVHIGYCIGRAWWGRGLTAEALAEVIRFFFTEVGANRVESMHDPNNPNSGKVMRKCGMACEGVLRAADWNNQGICGAAMHAILKEEYKT